MKIRKNPIWLAVFLSFGIGLSPVAMAGTSAVDLAFNALGGGQASGSSACQAAEQAAVAQCQSTFSAQASNIQNNVQQPQSTGSGSCLSGLLSTAQGEYSNLQSLASGATGSGITSAVEGAFSSLVSGFEQQFSSQVCNSLGQAWNSVSGNINSLANLPDTLGQAVEGYANQQMQQQVESQVSSLIQSGTNAVTNQVTQATNTVTQPIGSSGNVSSGNNSLPTGIPGLNNPSASKSSSSGINIPGA